MQLDDKQLDEDVTVILRATDPNKSSNCCTFDYQEQAFKLLAADITSNLAIHVDRSYAVIAHVESADAKAQLAMEAQIIEKEKEVLAELEAKLAEEGGPEGEEVEDSAALRNQFNFSERALQTPVVSRKDVEIMTVPPVSLEFAGTVTQADIWDHYVKDLAGQAAMLARSEDAKKSKKSKGAAEVKRLTIDSSENKQSKDPIYSIEMIKSLNIVERCVNQNAYDDILMDFKYWEDPADKLRPETGSALPLWMFKAQKTGGRMVTGITWNHAHADMFAVAFGSYDFTRQSTGMVCVYSLKNPSYPDYVYLTESGVMCVDFNFTVSPSMLCCGLYDGSIVVFDLGKRDPKYGTYSREPVIVSSLETGQHLDPVWQVLWSNAEESSGVISFRSLGSDGRLLKWSITTNELQVEEVMKFKLGQADDAYDLDESEVVGLASTTCLDFAPGDIYIRPCAHQVCR